MERHNMLCATHVDRTDVQRSIVVFDPNVPDNGFRKAFRRGRDADFLVQFLGRRIVTTGFQPDDRDGLAGFALRHDGLHRLTVTF